VPGVPAIRDSRAAFSQIQRFLTACSRLPARRVRSLAGMHRQLFSRNES
jgi:hypothetical protein